MYLSFSLDYRISTKPTTRTNSEGLGTECCRTRITTLRLWATALHCSSATYSTHRISRMRRNYCRSVISLQEPLPHSLWISLDLHGILAIVWTPACPVVSICVCCPPKRRVYNITSSSLLRKEYLLLLCCLLKVSQYQLALMDNLCPHCQGYLPAYL